MTPNLLAVCAELLDCLEKADWPFRWRYLFRSVADRARAALAQQPAPPADGEVAELMAWLRSLQDASIWFETGSAEDRKLTRAADLLERQYPQPIPVSERCPVADYEKRKSGELVANRCWCGRVKFEGGIGYTWEWTFADEGVLYFEDGYWKQWLPATVKSLPTRARLEDAELYSSPLPSGEVES